MSALQAGDPVADFELPSTSGGRFSLSEARRHGLVLYVFYKKSCGTCQFAFPYFQRFQESYAGKRFAIWGVAQDSLEDAAVFARDFGATFPQLSDEDLGVTEQYAPTAVPTYFLADSTDRILMSGTGFSTEGLNAIAAKVAESTGQPYVPVVRPEDGAPDFKPG